MCCAVLVLSALPHLLLLAHRLLVHRHVGHLIVMMVHLNVLRLHWLRLQDRLRDQVAVLRQFPLRSRYGVEVLEAVRLVAAAAGHQVKIPVVALLGVVVVMVAWAARFLPAAMWALWQLAGLRLRCWRRLCLRFSPLLLAAALLAAARPRGAFCIRKLTAVFVFFAAGSQFEYRTAFVH